MKHTAVIAASSLVLALADLPIMVAGAGLAGTHRSSENLQRRRRAAGSATRQRMSLAISSTIHGHEIVFDQDGRLKARQVAPVVV